jgi:squalene monooxygenase
MKEPDRIVGELLQPGGVNALEKLGMRGMFYLSLLN